MLSIAKKIFWLLQCCKKLHIPDKQCTVRPGRMHCLSGICMPTGGAIKLRSGRIFLSNQEAEMKLPLKVQAEKAFHRSTYNCGH